MISFKKIGLLETVVLLSAIYVFSTLIWTATTRSAVQEKANLVKSNHEIIVNFINNQVNTCDNSGKKEKTLWGDFCDETWSSKKIIIYLNSQLKLTNPYSKNILIVKGVQDPRLQAEGKAGQSTEIGVIFVSSSDLVMSQDQNG